MSQTWALEMARYGITINCIAPGPIATTAFWEKNPPGSRQVKEIIKKYNYETYGKP